MSTDAIIITAALLVCVCVGAAEAKGVIKLRVAIPLIVAILFLAGVGQAQASTHVNINSDESCCYDHHYGVTLVREGIFGDLPGFRPLWKLQQTFYWHTVKPWPPFKHLYNVSVRRSQWNGLAWQFNEYLVKSPIRFKTNPARWWVHVEASFTGLPNFYGFTDHNYPDIYMTLYRKTGDVTYTTRCDC